MLTATLSAILRRDLEGFHREVEAYPDEASVWMNATGVPNSGGVLTRHVCGNLQHFLGTVLGQTAYRRNREHEFNGPPCARAELLSGIAATQEAVSAVLGSLTEAQLAATYPQALDGHVFHVGDFLVHLATHCAFHLGQVGYHRRLLSASTGTMGPMGLRGLATARPAPAS